jgi:hypothetical protein
MSDDRLHHRTHRLVRHPEVTRHRTESLSLRPSSNLRPSIACDAWTSGHRGVEPDTQTLSRPEQAIRIQEGNQRWSDNVYFV